MVNSRYLPALIYANGSKCDVENQKLQEFSDFWKEFCVLLIFFRLVIKLA